MNPQTDPLFRDYLIDLGKQDGLAPDDVDYLIKNCFEEITFHYDGSGDEKAIITQTADGEVVIGVSKKIPNMRFHLGKVIFLVIKTGAKVAALRDTDIARLYFIMDFMKDLLELFEIELTKVEAQVLLGVYELSKKLPRHEVMTTNHAYDYLQNILQKNQIAYALENLDKIACITLTQDSQIVLNETIIIRTEI